MRMLDLLIHEVSQYEMFDFLNIQTYHFRVTRKEIQVSLHNVDTSIKSSSSEAALSLTTLVFLTLIPCFDTITCREIPTLNQGLFFLLNSGLF